MKKVSKKRQLGIVILGVYIVLNRFWDINEWVLTIVLIVSLILVLYDFIKNRIRDGK